LTVAHDGHVLSLSLAGGSATSTDSCGSGGLTAIVAPHVEQNLLEIGTGA
jgi:hypothetical protein